MNRRSDSKLFTRRGFIRQSALATGTGLAFAGMGASCSRSPNGKLNIAAIGAGGQGFKNLQNCASENIVALADVDRERGEVSFHRWKKAARYVDFRRMLDKEHKRIDGVIIATPDHMHAIAALWCMQAGLPVYVEKPLARTAWEARLLTRAANQFKVATQMGNQGYSHDATRVACEILWSGEIGEVQEVHAWAHTAAWPQGMLKIPPQTRIPDTLNWDLWLGGAQERPFTAGDEEYRGLIGEKFAKENFGFYLPFRWRAFPDFGSSLIGDWGVHILGPANMALKLGPEHLVSVECVQKDAPVALTFPNALTLKYEFAARPGGFPPVSVYWYHHPGGDAYIPPGMTVEEARKIPGTGPQAGPVAEVRAPESGRSGYNCIFVGSKGYMGTAGRGERVGLLPGSRWAAYKLPAATLPRTPGANELGNHTAHVHDWLRACKGGAQACSNFEIAGKFTEWLILGAAAVRCEGRLLWDNRKGEFTNSAEANQWIKPTYREGWEIHI